jgi:hypothetical protein
VELRTNGRVGGGGIEVYNSRGMVVQVLGGRGGPIRWVPGAEVSSGVYFARLLDGERPLVTKFVYLK